MEDFSVKLKKLRKKKGISQKVLGNKLGVGQTSIANYEADKRKPSLEIFISIADIFNVSLDYLAGTLEKEHGENSESNIEMVAEGKKLLEFLLEGNKSKSFNYILKLKEHGWHNRNIYNHIFIPVLWKIGDLWESGELSVGEEHFISNTILESIYYLQSVDSLKKEKSEKILMATVEQEEHMIALKIMDNILIEEGYDTYFLGDKTSSKHLVETIKLQEPRIIVISITLESLRPNLEKMVRMVRKSNSLKRVKIIVVGQGIKNKSEMIYAFGADAYGETFEDVLDIIKKWTMD